jgi:hypothetical protein
MTFEKIIEDYKQKILTTKNIEYIKIFQQRIQVLQNIIDDKGVSSEEFLEKL